MFSADTQVGQVFVQTTDNRGFTPEEIAERAVNRILSADTHERLKLVLIKYLQEAQDSAVMNARRILIENGFNDAAKRLEEE